MYSFVAHSGERGSASNPLLELIDPLGAWPQRSCAVGGGARSLCPPPSPASAHERLGADLVAASSPVGAKPEEAEPSPPGGGQVVP